MCGAMNCMDPMTGFEINKFYPRGLTFKGELMNAPVPGQMGAVCWRSSDKEQYIWTDPT